MSQMKWTKAQQAALSARGQNLLLAASAGSGKTAVLTARITELLSNTQEPVHITDLLVLTFTRAAAGEMKSRVASNLSKAIHEANEAGNHALSTQLSHELLRLSSAQISTLDSFFQSLIHQYFYLIDLDTNMKVLSDSNEIYLLQQEVLTEVMEQWYQKNDSAFNDCVDFLSNGFQDDLFKENILALYQFSCSLPFPDEWLKALPTPYDIPEDADLSALPYTQTVLEHYHGLVSDWCLSYQHLLDTLTFVPPLYSAYYDTLKKEAETLEALYKEKDWYAWQQILATFAFDRLKAVRKDKNLPPEAIEEMENIRTTIQTTRNSIKDELQKDLIPLFSVPASSWIKQIRTMHPLVKAFSDVTRDFARAYQERKQNDGLMEFNDMEHYALDILLNKSHPEFSPTHAADFPSEVALSLRQKYKEIMIDEYQDTNGVQELIAELISNGHNRFMVGDIKQSIYRFRQADPSIFLKKYETYESKEDTLHRRIDLNQNFRSDPTILSSINYIFRQLMNKEQLELFYSDKEALIPGRKEIVNKPDYIGHSVSLEIIDRTESEEDTDTEKEDVDNTALEARLIAGKIKELIDNKAQIMNPDGTFRDVAYHDIVILLRTMDKRAPLFLKACQEENIPAVADRDDDFMKSTEVQTLWSLLKIIDNPLQDLPLLAVLRSPLCGLDETDFALLHLADPKSMLWDNLHHHISELSSHRQEIVRQFLEKYEEWQAISYQNGVAPLIRDILESTDYLTWISGLPNGSFRKSHVRAFYDLALQRDKDHSNSLFSFLEYLRQSTKSFSSISPATEGNAIRVMSIHRSKGLEFPIVFLACTTKKFNMSDTNTPVIFHRTNGLGIHYYDKAHEVHWKTLCWDAVSLQVKKEALAEEARLLYVALTRAKDKIFMTAVIKDSVSSIANLIEPLALSRDEPMQFLPNHYIEYANSYLSWLLPAIARHPSSKKLWEYIGTSSAFILDHPMDKNTSFDIQITSYNELTDKPSTEKENISPAIINEDLSHFINTSTHEVEPWICRQLEWRYAHTAATLTPAKLTATAAVKLKEEQENRYAEEIPPPSAVLADNLPNSEETILPADFSDPPNFISQKKKLSGTSYGTLMHKAMEVMNLTALTPTEEAIQQEIKKLQKQEIFTDEEARILLSEYGQRSPVKDILTFLQSPLADAMKTAKAVRKEMPFSLLHKACDFYNDCGEYENIFIQGVMDCLIETDKGIIIIDYKTDRSLSAEELRTHYRMQLLVYQEAAKQLLQKKVIGLYLWSFHLGQMIPIE